MDWEKEIKKILFEGTRGWKKIFVYDDFRRIRDVVNKLIKEMKEQFSSKIYQIYRSHQEELNKTAQEKYDMGKREGYNQGFSEGYIKGTIEASKYFSKKLLKRSVIKNKKQNENTN